MRNLLGPVWLPSVFHCVFFASAILLAPGCGPELSEEELGRIEYRFPPREEIGEPYELPDLTPDAPPEDDDTPAAADSEADDTDDSDEKSPDSQAETPPKTAAPDESAE